MKHSVFCESIPLAILFSLLEKICPKNADNFYMVDKNVFRKMLFFDYHKEFLESVEPYYHKSKKYFVNEEFTYNRFVTLIRHICKHHQLHYYNDKKYDRSEYTICYFISKNISNRSTYSLS